MSTVAVISVLTWVHTHMSIVVEQLQSDNCSTVFKLLDIFINEKKFTIYEKFIVIIMYLAYLRDIIYQ